MIRLCLVILTVILAGNHATSANAAPSIELVCHITMDASGKRITHVLTIDLERNSITDGPMQWSAGDTSGQFSNNNLTQFVRRHGSNVQWGSEFKQTGKPNSVFTVDLETGAYLYFGPYGRNAEGLCRALPNVS